MGLRLPEPESDEPEALINVLRGVADWSPDRPDTIAVNRLVPLQADRERLLAIAREAQSEIDAAQSFFRCGRWF